jgi:hypothetical protein
MGFLFVTSICHFILHILWREGRSVAYNSCWPSPAHSFSGPSPARLMTITHCLQQPLYCCVTCREGMLPSDSSRACWCGRVFSGRCLAHGCLFWFSCPSTLWSACACVYMCINYPDCMNHPDLKGLRNTRVISLILKRQYCHVYIFKL